MTDSTPDPDQSASRTKRRWNAFVCQDCRSIFRIPADYIGKGVVCPRCERMLRIPSVGESIPALVQPPTDGGEESRQTIATMEQMHVADDPTTKNSTQPHQAATHTAETNQVSTEVHSSSTGRRRKKHRSRSRDAENDWQSDQPKRLRFSQKKNWLQWWVASAVLVVLLTIMMSVLLMDQKRHTTSAKTEISPSIQDSLVSLQLEKDQRLNEQNRKIAQIQQAYECAESFLHAKTVDEMLPWIRQSPGMEDRVKSSADRYFDPSWNQAELDRQTMTVIEDDRILQFTVAKEGRPSKALVLFKDDDRYLVDWESWVGWCEMTCDQIQKNKPLQPVEVRVFVELESYYNFDYPPSVESEWQSFRLNFPYEDRFVYGYLRRDDPLIDRMRVASSDYNGAMTLTIRYKEAGSNASQLMIDGVVSNSWVKGFSRP